MDPKPDANAPAASEPAEHAAYPRLSPEEMAPPPPPVVPPAGANPYVLSAPSPNPPAKSELLPVVSCSSLLRFGHWFWLLCGCPDRSGFGGGSPQALRTI